MEESEIQKDLEKSGSFIWNMRSLCVIYHNAVQDRYDVKECHIDTFGNILCEYAEKMLQHYITFEEKHYFH